MRLAEFMESRQLTDLELSQRVGCPEVAIRRLRCGYVRPSLERAFAIEQVSQGEVSLADWQYPVRYKPHRPKSNADSTRSSQGQKAARG
jgi:transcriptional regulator with XRE-family HTH domain